MFCNNCGAKITDDSQFCPQCGTKAQNEPLVCKHCGEPLEADSKFCGKCGLRTWLKGTEPPKTDLSEYNYTGVKTGRSYTVSIISAIVCFIIRLFTQSEHHSYENIWNNRYIIGIDSDLKPFLTAIPIIAAIIASLLIVSDDVSSSRKKASAFIINGVFIALAILFIWFDIPYKLFDF